MGEVQVSLAKCGIYLFVLTLCFIGACWLHVQQVSKTQRTILRITMAGAGLAAAPSLVPFRHGLDPATLLVLDPATIGMICCSEA